MRDWKTNVPIMKPTCIVDCTSKVAAVDWTGMLLSYVQCKISEMVQKIGTSCFWDTIT
jgi:hypothetical protein